MDHDQFHGKEHTKSREIGEDLVSDNKPKKIHEEIEDMNMEKFELQLDEGDDKKKNEEEEIEDDIGREVKSKELALNKRRKENVC